MNVRALLGLAASAVAFGAASVSATELFALDAAGQIARVDSNAPGTILSSVQTSGLQGDQKLLGIDFRPVDGQLYGLGVDVATGLSTVYTVNLATGALTAVGSGFTFSGLTPTKGPLVNTVALDFNPVADRMRVVINGSLSYRVNQLNGTLVAQDTTLAYAAGDPANGKGGATPSISAVAYSNSFGGAAATTLYGYDNLRNTIVTIGGPNGTPSPNSGTTFTVGSSGFSTSLNTIGFEIVGGEAFLLAAVSSDKGTEGTFFGYQLFSVDLATGLLTPVGAFGDGTDQYLSLTAAPVVPEPATTALVASGLLGLALARRRRK